MNDATTTTKFDPSKIKEAGPAERGDFSNQQNARQSMQQDAPPVITPTDNGESGKDKQDPPPAEVKLPDLNDDQVKEFFKSKGIDGFDGNFEALKEKLAKVDAPASPELTEEQKKAAEVAMNTRMLNRYLETGGTAEQFVALQQIASMDLRELSVAEIKKELSEKFTPEEIDIVLKERYYQINPDELEQTADESDEDFNKRKEFLKKKVAAFAPKLETRGTHTKQKAESFLNNLRESIKAEDLAVEKEAKFSSKVDEISTKLPREITFELGEIGKIKQDPVVFKVTDADIAEVAGTLKDPAKRQQFLFNEDKTLNLTNLMNVMLRNKYLESALKATYIEGGNRQVAALEKVFPGAAHALGVGGATVPNKQGRKGVFVSAGQPEVAVPQHK